MLRKIDRLLDEWADNDQARPLLIRGARRVGKTYAIKRLGEERFAKQDFAYLDFQTNLEQLSLVFSQTSDIERIVSDLAQILRREIVAKKTLIALDEVQLCESALNSLRFFAESDYRIIATGSQLGLTMRNRSLPFPSGIEVIDLHPMDFEEYLWAAGEQVVGNAIRESFYTKSRLIIHDEALKLYRQYTVIGGMPTVVSAFLNSQDHDQVRTLQAEIDHTYSADIALYAPSDSVVHTLAVWSSIPRQLARENTRKFKYADVASGGRERVYRTPLAWLEAASLVSLNYQTNETTAPLIARDGGSFFKVYLADTGIMFYRLNLDAEVFLDDSRRSGLSPRFRGALAENYVMQALTANNLETFYWTPGTTSQNEIEFVLQNRLGQIIPIEVKSGDNVRSASLSTYLQKTGAPYAIRLSTRNFGYENSIFSVPLYAAFCIDEKSLMS